MPDSAGSKKAAAFSRGTHVERKEFRRRIRLMSQKVSGLLAYIYSIPDFLAGANFCRIFSLAPAGNRHSAAVSGRIFVSWPSEPGIPPAAFRTIISLYRDRRAKPPASHCTSFRLDRPALSRPPYLLYRANLGLPFVNNVSFQAPSAPAITFQEPQVNLPHLISSRQKSVGEVHLSFFTLFISIFFQSFHMLFAYIYSQPFFTASELYSWLNAISCIHHTSNVSFVLIFSNIYAFAI